MVDIGELKIGDEVWVRKTFNSWTQNSPVIVITKGVVKESTESFLLVICSDNNLTDELYFRKNKKEQYESIKYTFGDTLLFSSAEEAQKFNGNLPANTLLKEELRIEFEFIYENISQKDALYLLDVIKKIS